MRGGYAVPIDNIGGMVAPVDLVVAYTDGSTETVHQTPRDVGRRTGAARRLRFATQKTIQSIALDGGIWMDADTSNNRWPAK